MELVTINPVDRERIRVAVEDHAGRYGAAAVPAGADSTARYVSEGHLKILVTRYGLGVVWRAVAEVIAARPELLTDTAPVREARAARRAAECARINDKAGELFQAGNIAGTLRELDRGEKVSPDHLFNGHVSWEDLRRFVGRG